MTERDDWRGSRPGPRRSVPRAEDGRFASRGDDGRFARQAGDDGRFARQAGDGRFGSPVDPARPAGSADQGRFAVHQAQVRWSDADALGHVNHARYLSFFEDARMELLARSPTGLPGTRDEQGCIAARVTVDYLSPVEYRPDLSLRVVTRVSRVGNSSWTLVQEMADGRRRVATCECVLVGYEYAGAKPRPLDDSERAFWTGYLVAGS